MALPTFLISDVFHEVLVHNVGTSCGAIILRKVTIKSRFSVKVGLHLSRESLPY